VRKHGGEIEERRWRLQAGASPVAAPRPFVGLRAQAAFYRVADRIPKGPEKLRLTFLQDRAEPVLEKVGFSSVSAIEAQRVSAVQSLHGRRKCPVRSLEHEVVVIREEAVGEAPQLVFADNTVEAHEEIVPI
jgi:hypothetical protein